MIEVDVQQLKQARVALYAHRHALPESYTEEKLREISMLIDQVCQELTDHNYVILEQKKGDRTNEELSSTP